MADYVGVLADLKARLAAIDEERAELDLAMKGVERLMARFSTSNPTPHGARDLPLAHPLIPSRAFVGLTMPEAIKGFFKSQMLLRPYSTREVQDGVRAGGVKGAKNLRGHVYNTLHRLSQDDGPFVHHPDGRWSLREWKLLMGEGEANQTDPAFRSQ